MRTIIPGDHVRTWPTSMFSMGALGLAFLQMWSTSLYSGTTLSTAAGNLFGADSPTHRAALVTIILSLVVLAFLHGSTKLVRRSAFQTVALVAIEAGTLCLLAMAWLGGYPLLLIGLGTVLTGIGSAMLTAAWCAAYSRLEPKAIFPTTVGAFLFSNLFIAALGEYPTAVSYVLVVLAPVASTVCLGYFDVPIFDGSRAEECRGECVVSHPARSARLELGQTVLYALLFSAVVGAVGSFDRLNGGLGTSYGVLIVLAVAAVSIAVTAFAGGLRVEVLLIAPGILLAVALLAIPFFQASAAFQTLASAGRLLGRMAIWAYLAHVFARGGYSPLLFFGGTLAAHYTGLMLGELLAHKIFPTEQAGTQTELFAFALVVMFLLVAAYLVGMQVSVARRNAGEPAPVSADSASRPYEERIAQVSRHYGLTEREQALLWHLAKGYSSKVIQEKLSISASTVSAHSGSIYRKMGVHSKDEAAAVIRSWDGSGL